MACMLADLSDFGLLEKQKFTKFGKCTALDVDEAPCKI